jgi:hypothetical protein
MGYKILAVIPVIFLLSFTAHNLVNAQEPNPVILTNMELVTVTGNSASITWVTNLPADTGVQWGTTDQLGEENIIEAAEIYHIAWILDLDQGTEYFYRVGSGGRWSDISSFTTLTAPDGYFELTFAFIADTHYDVDGRDTPNGFMYGESTRLTASMVEAINRDESIDFVITGGDLTNTGVEEDFQGFAAAMDQLDVPWYPVLGNHDKANLGWEDWYRDHIGWTDTYYSLDEGSYRLIILDSAVAGQVSGGLDEAQLNWLESELDAYPDRPTLLFMHHMTDRTDINGIDEESKSNFDSIIESRPNVLAVHCGHVHANIIDESGVPAIDTATAAVVSYPIGYAKINLYSRGYSQAFFKLESELQTSEESRLRLSASSSSEDEALGDLEERSFVRTVLTNKPPSLSSINAYPASIYTGEVSSITVTASDPEGASLTYNYETNGGTISGNGPQVTYTAPDIHGTYQIVASVSDGELSSAEKTVEIDVKLKGTNDIPGNRAPIMENIIANTLKAAPGEVVYIEVSAEDEDGDRLEYSYASTGGTITGSGKSVQWRAPESTGEYRITAWVSDGSLESAKKSLTIMVEEQQSVSEDNGLSGFSGATTIIAASLVFILIYRRK